MSPKLIAATTAATTGLALVSGALAQPAVTTQTIATGLNRPVFATHAPGDTDRLFVIEKRGIVKIIDLTTNTVNGTPFLDIDALVVNISSGSDERGFLGMAFDPEYATNGYFYVSYINNANDSAIVRYTVSANPDIADTNTRRQLFTVDQPQSNHNGGWIGFGHDDLLYVAIGDGGGANDLHGTYGNAQNLNNRLGAMLRVDPHATDAGNYGIPSDNPFVGIDGDDAIWGWGLRNPWRNSFDRATGDFWIADVGQNAWEEINIQPASSTGGENYGWRCREGMHNFNTGPAGSNCGVLTMTEPVFEYSHSGGNCSVTGGYVYRGCAMPGMDAFYIYADYCAGQVRALVPPNYTTSTSLGISLGFGLTSFGEDAYGEVYVVHGTGTSNGRVLKIVPTLPPPDADGDGIPDSCEPCLADWNGDGFVNTSDFLAYLNDYNAVLGGGSFIFNDPDLAAPFGVLNTSDFVAFLNLYNAGC